MSNDEQAVMSPEHVTASFRPKPHPDVRSIVLEGEAVLWDERSGALHHLDAVGSVVWQVLDGSASIGELAEELADAYGTDATTIEDDIVSLVRDLGAKGLLEGVERAAHSEHTHDHVHEHGHDNGHDHASVGDGAGDAEPPGAAEELPARPRYIEVRGGG